MEMKIEVYGKVEGGKLCGFSRKRLAAELLQFEGKPVRVVIEKKKSMRSVQQNRLWWLYMNILSAEIGYTKDEMHEIAKYKFLKTEKVDERTGEVFPYIGSTAKLSKSEFSDLTAELQQWASETFNVVLPSPDEQIYLFDDSRG